MFCTMFTGWPSATGSAAIRTAIAVEDEVGDAETRRGDVKGGIRGFYPAHCVTSVVNPCECVRIVRVNVGIRRESAASPCESRRRLSRMRREC
eukprot:4211898-Prymnesium_polylepis.1